MHSAAIACDAYPVTLCALDSYCTCACSCLGPLAQRLAASDTAWDGTLFAGLGFGGVSEVGGLVGEGVIT